MYNMVTLCIEIIAVLLQGFCMQYFFSSFLESRLPPKRWNEFLITALYGIVRFAMNMVLPADYGEVRIFGRLVLTVCGASILICCFYKAVNVIAVFLVISFMAVSEICFFIAYMILYFGQYCTDFWLWCMEKGYIISEVVFMEFVEITLLALYFLHKTVFIILLFFSLKSIIRNFRQKDYPIQRTELIFILTPGLVGLLICVLLRMIMITVENNVPLLLYNKYPNLAWIVPAIMFLCLLSVLYGVKLFQDMIDLNQERNSRVILEKQISSMQEHMKEMELVYSGVRSMKHDMKNTLSVIMQLAAKDGKAGNAEFQAYLSQLNRSMDRLEFHYKTGNTVVDTLLNMKQHEIGRIIPGIEINADRLVFPNSLTIQSYDIGVILGNALDNGIEACRKLKEEKQDADIFIRLSSFQRGKMFFIEVENSFDGKLIWNKESEFPTTKKEDRKAHGIGLSNIKNTAQKYSGAVDWQAEGNVFLLSVMMKVE